MGYDKYANGVEWYMYLYQTAIVYNYGLMQAAIYVIKIYKTYMQRLQNVIQTFYIHKSNTLNRGPACFRLPVPYNSIVKQMVDGTKMVC